MIEGTASSGKINKVTGADSDGNSIIANCDLQ